MLNSLERFSLFVLSSVLPLIILRPKPSTSSLIICATSFSRFLPLKARQDCSWSPRCRILQEIPSMNLFCLCQQFRDMSVRVPTISGPIVLPQLRQIIESHANTSQHMSFNIFHHLVNRLCSQKIVGGKGPGFLC